MADLIECECGALIPIGQRNIVTCDFCRAVYQRILPKRNGRTSPQVYEPAVSPPAVAEVLKKLSSMTIKGTSPTMVVEAGVHHVVKGDIGTFTGKLTDAITGVGLGGRPFYLYRGDGVVIDGVTNPDGSYSIEGAFPIEPVITQYYRVLWDGDAEYDWCQSEIFYFTVEARTPNLTLSMPSSGKPEESVTWSGKMTDPKVTTYGIPDKDVYLQESTDGVTFTDVAGPIMTGSDGSYSGTYSLPTTLGTYYYRSRFPGGSIGAYFQGAVSPVAAVRVGLPPKVLPLLGALAFAGTVMGVVYVGERARKKF